MADAFEPNVEVAAFAAFAEFAAEEGVALKGAERV